jgi:hypothetical protein
MFGQLRAALTGGFFAGVIVGLLLGPVPAMAQTRPATLIPTNAKFTTVTVTGQITAPVGSNSAPSYTFTGNTNTGFYSGGAGSGAVIFAGNATRPVEFTGSGVFIAADGVLAMSATNGNATAALDSGLSRIGVGSVAVGNGTNGNTTGKITATYVSTGSGMAVANVAANSCGTTAATIAGGNNAFVITVGATSGTQCRVAFTFAAANEWDCVEEDQTTASLAGRKVTPVDTTHTDFFGTYGAGDKITGICFPR